MKGLFVVLVFTSLGLLAPATQADQIVPGNPPMARHAKPPRAGGERLAPVARAAAAASLSDCRESIRGVGGDDNEVQAGVNKLYYAGYKPTGAWRWAYYNRRDTYVWRQDVEFQRTLLGGNTTWAKARDTNVCADLNHSGAIGATEDWIEGWAEWPGWGSA